MLKNDDRSSQAPSSSLNPRNWLKLAEYASVAGSALGSLAAALSGQILYAAAPLTIALSLNLVNRQRFEIQTQEKVDSAIADVHTVVQSLHQQVQHSLPEEAEDIDAILSDLQYKLRNLETTVLGQQDWETVNVRFMLIDEKLAEIKNTVAELQPQNHDSINLNPIQLSLDQLESFAHQSTLDFTVMQAKIHQLHEEFSELQHQNRDVIKPYLQKLTRALKKLQKEGK